MDLLQWCFPFFLEKGLLRSKMAPYLLNRQGEQEGSRSEQRDHHSLDAIQNFSGVGLETRWKNPMGTPPTSTEYSRLDKYEIVDKLDDTAFGIELKCLMPLLVHGEQDPEPDDPRQPTMTLHTNTDDVEATREQAYKAIAKTIRQAGYSATTIGEITHANFQERDYWESHWIVKRANSAEPTASQKALKGYIWVSIEISSPKHRANDDPKTYTSVEAVMDILRANHRLVSNYTCDIHVHIGRMDDQPFQLPTLKRLAMLLWMAEPVLRTIRDPKSPNYDNLYTWGAELRRFSRLAEQVQRNTEGIKHEHLPREINRSPIEDDPLSNLLDTTTAHDQSDIQALQTISRSPTHRSLGMLLSGRTKQYRRLGFNFSAFGEEDARARSNPRTVEFRIMEGTVRSGLVVAWLRVCKAIVGVAVGEGGGNTRFARVLEELLEGGAEDGSGAEKKFVALMRDLELEEGMYRVLLEKVVRENY